MAKSYLGNGNSYGKTKVSAFCIQLLVDLYMAATPKSPFKCAIARFVFQLILCWTLNLSFDLWAKKLIRDFQSH
jgi:hypothetical protein